MKRGTVATLLVASLALVVVVLAQSYIVSRQYSLGWNATWLADLSKLSLWQYSASWTASWYGGLAPGAWLTAVIQPLASWSVSPVPVTVFSVALRPETLWQSRWYLSIGSWTGGSVYVEGDPGVKLLSGFWDGGVSLSGNGTVTINATGVLATTGNVTSIGNGLFLVSGSGGVHEVAKCYLADAVSPVGVRATSTVYVNGTEVSVGGSFKCLSHSVISVSLPGGARVGSIEVNRALFRGATAYLANNTEYFVTVYVRGRARIIVESLNATGIEPNAAIKLSGRVVDATYGAPVPGAVVTVRVDGKPVTAVVTLQDGSFYASAFATAVAGEHSIRVEADHYNYDADPYEASFTVSSAPGPLGPLQEVVQSPLLLALVAAVVAVAVALVASRVMGVARAVSSSEFLE